MAAVSTIEPAADAASSLRAAQDHFVALWSRMGGNWGIPRAVAETHALLFIVGEPLNTDDVMDRLRISRGGASTALRSLEDWGLLCRVHIPGDRKEYFQAEQDVWKVFRVILRERKKREVDPVLESLRACRALTNEKEADAVDHADHNRRVDGMLQFMEMIDAVAQHLDQPDGLDLEQAAGLLCESPCT